MYYIDESKLNYIGEICPSKALTICPCDDVILNEECWSRLFLKEEAFIEIQNGYLNEDYKMTQTINKIIFEKDKNKVCFLCFTESEFENILKKLLHKKADAI